MAYKHYSIDVKGHLSEMFLILLTIYLIFEVMLVNKIIVVPTVFNSLIAKLKSSCNRNKFCYSKIFYLCTKTIKSV